MSEVPVLNALNGATRVYAIIGDPIAQVKSPAGVTRMFNERGLNAVVVPIQISSDKLDAFIEGVSLAKNFDGIIVTIPHKFASFAHCKTGTERAKMLGSVNVLRRNEDGSWDGEMFDGLGMLGGIASQGGNPKDKKTLLVGAGGAGTAIAQALLEAGVTELAIHDADTTRRDNLIALLQKHYGSRVYAGSNNPEGFALVVNATPMGMRAEDPYPVDVDKLSPDAFVGCVITAPAVSPWVQAARDKGCRGSVGIDMYQAEQKLMVDFYLDK